MTKECRNIPKCYLCKEEGHRTETLVCPIYKQMLGSMKGLNANPIHKKNKVLQLNIDRINLRDG